MKNNREFGLVLVALVILFLQTAFAQSIPTVTYAETLGVPTLPFGYTDFSPVTIENPSANIAVSVGRRNDTSEAFAIVYENISPGNWIIRQPGYLLGPVITSYGDNPGNQVSVRMSGDVNGTRITISSANNASFVFVYFYDMNHATYYLSQNITVKSGNSSVAPLGISQDMTRDGFELVLTSVTSVLLYRLTSTNLNDPSAFYLLIQELDTPDGAESFSWPAFVSIDAYGRTLAVTGQSGFVYLYKVAASSTNGSFSLDYVQNSINFQLIYSVKVSGNGSIVFVNGVQSPDDSIIAVTTRLGTSLWSSYGLIPGLVFRLAMSCSDDGMVLVTPDPLGPFQLPGLGPNSIYQQAPNYTDWIKSATLPYPPWSLGTGVQGWGLSSQYSLTPDCSRIAAGHYLNQDGLGEGTGSVVIYTVTNLTCSQAPILPPFPPIGPPVTPPPPITMPPQVEPITNPPQAPSVADNWVPSDAFAPPPQAVPSDSSQTMDAIVLAFAVIVAVTTIGVISVMIYNWVKRKRIQRKVSKRKREEDEDAKL